RQDDNGAARPPHPSLRDRRDRQRILALQTPRLTVTPACPGGQTGTSRAALRRTRGGRSAPRGALLFATGTTPTPERGHDWTPIQGQTSTPIDNQDEAARDPLTLHGHFVSRCCGTRLS